MRGLLRDLYRIHVFMPWPIRIVMFYSLVPVVWWAFSSIIQQDWAYVVMVPLFSLEMLALACLCVYTLRESRFRQQVLDVLSHPGRFEQAPPRVQDRALYIVSEVWTEQEQRRWRGKMPEPGS